MTPRVKNPFKTAPDGIKAMMALEASIKASGLEHGLLELVKLRASQLNGCAFCIHMHATDARARGESEMRLYMLNAWRESPLYTDRERAALAWTEALTLVALPARRMRTTTYSRASSPSVFTHFGKSDRLAVLLPLSLLTGDLGPTKSCCER